MVIDPSVVRLRALVRTTRELLAGQRSEAAQQGLRRMEQLAAFWEEALAQREQRHADRAAAEAEASADLQLRAEVLQDCAALARAYQRTLNLAADDLAHEVRRCLQKLGAEATALILDVERLDLCVRLSEERMLRARQRDTRSEIAELAAQEELTRCLRELEQTLGARTLISRQP